MPRTQALPPLDPAYFAFESGERMPSGGLLATLKPPPRTRWAKAFADRVLRTMVAQPVGHPFDMRFRPPALSTAVGAVSRPIAACRLLRSRCR